MGLGDGTSIKKTHAHTYTLHQRGIVRIKRFIMQIGVDLFPIRTETQGLQFRLQKAPACWGGDRVGVRGGGA